MTRSKLIAIVLISFTLIFLHQPPKDCSSKAVSNLFDNFIDLAPDIGFDSAQMSYYNPSSLNIENCNYGWKSFVTLKKISTDDTLQYASLSKILTAMILMDFSNQGMVDLNSPLLKYVEKVGLYKDTRWRDVTIHDLLLHRSGLTTVNSYDPMLIEKPFCPNSLERLDGVQLRVRNQQDFEYSNLGYCFLGVVIEKVAQLPIDSYFYQELLTDIDIFPAEKRDRCAVSY